jgi:hypothetical protein
MAFDRLARTGRTYCQNRGLVTARQSTWSPAILFKPSAVRQVLATLPSVAALLPDPDEEGVDSEAFPGVLRKTEREVYRWIANTHYEHLADAVAHLERVYAAGCTFDRLLTTPDRELFASLAVEALVADDLLRRGYEVKTVPRTDQPSPDLHVVVNGLDVAVEVYSPREYLPADEWVHDVTDLLNYVDIRASYHSQVNTRRELSFPPHQVQLNPWAVAQMLAQTRDDVPWKSPATSRRRFAGSIRSAGSIGIRERLC